MCGISGVTGKSDVVRTLFESIKNLEYRGYDSCGLAVVQKGEVAVRKNTGGVDEVNQKEHLTGMQGTTGIAHTRWATHGGVTRINAHPHSSADGLFSLVHNGIINNYRELRAELESQGVTFASETDTEVAVQLVAHIHRTLGNVEESFRQALLRLQGTYAIAMITAIEPHVIFCAREGSPLALGFSKQGNFVASDVNAFLPYTRDALLLEDGEYALVTPDDARVMRLRDRQPVQRKHMKIEWDAETSRKGGYSHYMLKEIFDQPRTVLNAMHIPQQEIDALAESIQASRQTYLMGVGTTHFVGQVAQYFFSQLAGRFIPAVSADEFRDLAVIGPGDLLISISQSGETFDTRQGVEYAKSRGAATASIVNVMGSSLSLMTDQVILQGSGPEICVVSTKAALAQMVILLRVALALGQRTGHIDAGVARSYAEALADFSPTVQRALNELSGFVRNLADRTVKYHNWLVMGRGIYYAVAQEAALKMKEVTYLHVEGLPAGFLKHGTLSLVDEHMASLFLVPPPALKELHALTVHAIEQVKARGGPVFAFYFESDTKTTALLTDGVALPDVSPAVSPFMMLVVAQLFSYFCALKLGRSIDKPRNLAKSVTVG
jgi:glucosamine--fructose-6-phosphate aminotransferase (isomerizing)